MIDLKFIVDTTQLDKAIRTTNKAEVEIRRMAKAVDSGSISTEQYYTRVKQLSSGLQSVVGGNIAARNAIFQYANATLEATKKTDALEKEVKQATVAQTRYKTSVQQTSGYVNQFGENVDFSGKRVNVLGQRMQGAGYQIGDFAVQVQSGTSWLVALGQQGAQLLGMFGPAGALAGAGLAIGTALVLPFTRASKEVKSLREEFSKFDQQVKEANSFKEYFDLSLGTVGQSPAVREQKALLEELAQQRLEIEKAIAAGGIAPVGEEDFRTTGGLAEMAEEAGAVIPIMEAVKTLQQESLEVSENSTSELEDQLRVITAQEAQARKLLRIHDMMNAAAQAFKDRQEANRKADEDTTALQRRVQLAEAELYYGKESSEYKKLEAQQQIEILDASLREKKVSEDRRELMKQLLSDALQLEESIRRTSQLDLNNLSFGFRGVKSAQVTIGDGTTLDLGNGQTEVLDLPGNKRETKGGGGGRNKETAEQYLAKLQREIDLKKSLLGVFGSEAEVLTRVQQLKEQVIDKELKISDAQLEKIAKEEEALDKLVNKQQEMFQSFESTISNGLLDLVTGAQSVEEAFKSMIFNIVKEIYTQQVVNPLAEAGSNFLMKSLGSLTLSAKGNVFSGGSLKAFAKGGVVEGPTYFPMRGNTTGLMGEAGPEAIMPLKRTSNGDLGVQVTGSSQATEIVVSLSPELIAQVLQKAEGNSIKVVEKASKGIVNASVQAVAKSRRQGGSMKAAFGN